MTGGIPAVEVTDDRNTLGIGSPDGKVCAVEAVAIDDVSAQLFLQAEVRAFVEQVEILIGEQRDIVALHVRASSRASPVAARGRLQTFAGMVLLADEGWPPRRTGG